MGIDCFNGDSLTNNVVPVSLSAERVTALIVERARQLVNRLIQERGHDKPPFLPEGSARMQGINKPMKADLGKTSAVLLRFQNSYVIKVNQNHSLVRQNFSCSHEIGHILFDELKLEGYIRSIEYRTFNPEGERRARAVARERLCDAAATELLMPEMVFKKYLTGYDVSVHSIEWLANIFRVSVQATAIRIAELSTEPCIALKWEPWLRTKSKELRMVWRVGPGRESRGKTNYVPTHTYVRPTPMLYKAYEDDNSVKSSKFFKVDNVVKRLPVESKGFGRGETRYVISLAFPDR